MNTGFPFTFCFFFDTLTGTYNLGGTDIVFPDDFGVTKDMGTDHSYRYIKLPTDPTVDWIYPDVYWQGSIDNGKTKIIETTQRPTMFIWVSTRADTPNRNLVIWDDVRQEGVVGRYSSSSDHGYSPILDVSTYIPSITNSSFTVKNNASSNAYYYTILAWY